MKRIFFTLALLALACSAFGWDISNYVIKMDVQSDSSILVTETVYADFTGDAHRGIFRDLPYSMKDKYGNNRNVRYDITSVTNENGTPWQFTQSKQNGRLRLRIGDPNVTFDTPQVYLISYKLTRAIHYFDQWDELYWNAIGSEWEVPIRQAEAIVTLPKDVPGGPRMTSYTGTYGMTSSDAIGEHPNGHTAHFVMKRPLTPGESMTIVVGWPKGVVAEPSKSERWWGFIKDNGFFFLPPAFILLLFFYWKKFGCDPDTGRSVMVAYEPPDDLRPAELGTLIDEKVDMRDISATIIDLAVRGYLTITPHEYKGFLTSKSDYCFDLKKPYDEAVKDPDLKPFEREMIRGIFSAGESRWMSSLENNFYVYLPKLRDHLYNAMTKYGYFGYRPDSVRSNYLSVGLLIAAVGIVGALMASNEGTIPVGWPIALAVCGGILALSSKAMPRKTAKGKDALVNTRGFEEYLSRAERNDIHMQEKLDQFEKFLPYAMAFGVANKWARAFEGLELQTPSWYGGGGSFYPILFVNDLDYATSSWANSMASTPRSQGGGSSWSGGGSGFSGGSSGGGGGGGGGGGW